MNRLNFNNVKLLGRSQEFEVLQDAYKRVRNEQCKTSEIVMVHGYSGTGKSSLVRRLKTWMKESEHDNGYFVAGKFEEQRSTEPYYALANAFNELCDLILASNDKDQTVASFWDAVGAKGKVLLDVVPRLNKLIGDMEGDSGNKGTATALNQLKFVFRAFARTVCTVTKHPIVLFLDDLQWADMASLELIKSLMNDSESKRILFIGAYRDSEVDENHPLALHLRSVEEEKQIHSIQLGNLDKESVNGLISGLIELNPESTQPLSDLVFHKTSGNIFFVLQFLRMLNDDKLLYFSFKTYKWTWDMDKINAQTNLSENVVDMVAGKIGRMPFKTRVTLKLAACLWSTFDVELLREVLLKAREKYEADGQNCEQLVSADDDLVLLLDKAADEGVLDKLGGTRYKFGHDRIQQAAYSLIEGKDRERMHNRVGEILWEMTKSSRCEEWMYFAAADQMNRGADIITDETERVELARLNLLVAEKAISLSAFVPASMYLKSGINLIPKEKRWGEYHGLSLRLYNALADTEHCTGNADRTQEIVAEILAHTKSCEDKINAMYTLGLSKVSQSEQQEAVQLCYDMLEKLGEPLPKRVTKALVALEAARLKRMLRGKSDEDLLKLSPMKDYSKLTAARFQDLAITARMYLGMLRDSSFIGMRMMRLTLKFGFCDQSAIAYALWGEVLVSQGNFEEGYRFGKLALELLQKHESRSVKTRVVCLVQGFLCHWKEPLPNTLGPLLDAYKSGMLNGDITWSFQSIVGYESTYYYAGLPLESGVEDLISFSKQVKEYKQEVLRRLLLPMLQMMLNLMGRSRDVLELTGDVMNQDEFEDRQTNPHRVGVQVIMSCRMQLAYYFGDLELAAELSKKLQSLTKDTVFTASYLVCVRTFFRGLISMALARRTKKRKHAANAAKMISTMENKWVKRGAVNCLHKLLILKAEYATLKPTDNRKVKEAFDAAISTARRVGFIQDEALANERAGDFFLQKRDHFWASSYLSRSHELYSEWGAKAKAEQLEDTHGSLIAEHEAQHSSHSRGRQRFVEESSKSAKSLNTTQLFNSKGSSSSLEPVARVRRV